MKNFIKSIFGSKVVENNAVVESNDNSMCILVVGGTTDTTVSSNGGFDRYIGIGVCNVLAVNPTAKEIESIMGFTPKQEPEYTGVDQNGNKTMRINFIVKTVPEDNNGIETTGFLSINLTCAPVVGSTSGKVQVIDDYGCGLNSGNVMWGDPTVVDAGKPVVYKDGAQRLIGSYHKCFRGEHNLLMFLRAFLGVPQATNWVNGTSVVKEGAELAKAQLKLEKPMNLFKGDVSEIKEAIELQPNNKIKLLFGVRTADDGSLRQDINGEVFMNARQNKTTMIERYITEAKEAGRYANVEYNFEPLSLYKITPTDFKEIPANEVTDPFVTATPVTDNTSNIPF